MPSRSSLTLDIYVLTLDGSPEPFYPNVIQTPTHTVHVHAYSCASLFPCWACILTALVGVDNLRLSVRLYGQMQRLYGILCVKHPKKNGEKRGRKRIKKQKYKPQELSNGYTKVELLARSRNLLAQSGKKWGEHKKERAKLLFEIFPQMNEAYSLICKVRDIFKRKLTIDEARTKLHEWYKDVNACTFRDIKSARDCIKSREEEVLNYFIKRSINASAESLNSKMKGFRAQLHGIADIPFFLYRVCTFFG